MGGFLRQYATVAFGPSTGTDYQRTVTMPQALLGTANSRLVICMSVGGPGHGQNDAFAPNGLSIATNGIDVGDDDATGSFSTDILIWDEIAGDGGGTGVRVAVGASYPGSYVAAWIGEYTAMDQTMYGYDGNPPGTGNKRNYNGNVDYDASTGGTGSGSTVTCTRGGGKSVNYTPELGVWCVGGTGSIAVTGQTYTPEGYVTDGVNIWIAVQDSYFNATGVYNPTFSLASAAPYWNWFNLTMKTLGMPASGPPVGTLGLLGVGR